LVLVPFAIWFYQQMSTDGGYRSPDAVERAKPEAEVDAAMEKLLSVHSYRFSIEQTDAWIQHLTEKGFVVVGNALSSDEVTEAKKLLWDDIEERYQEKEVSRNDMKSWENWPVPEHGLISTITQRKGPWYVRGCQGIKRVFSNIWKADDLIVSMDCVIAWKPWWASERFSRPQTEGMHLDQNPFTKPNLECYQGMVPLVPVTAESGGLQVVPFSHTDAAKEVLKAEHQRLKAGGDWCPLFRDYDDAVLLHANAGDLILWDSRTIHGGIVGTGPASKVDPNIEASHPPELARMSVVVDMVPRAWASAGVLEERKKGFSRGINFNHSPHEAGTSTGTVRGVVKRGYVPIELTEAQSALL